jgi:hypothetical protein
MIKKSNNQYSIKEWGEVHNNFTDPSSDAGEKTEDWLVFL